MNPRILELAEQSGLFHRLAAGTPYPSALSAEECETYYAKFAQLLIQECVEKVYNHATLFKDTNYKLDDLMSDIKKDFGIE